MGRQSPITPRAAILRVLRRQDPGRFLCAPNYWQWYAHQRNHGLLPPELRHCESQLDLILFLGLDVFSRNVYCDPTEYWFGGLSRETWTGAEVDISRHAEGKDTVTDKICRAPSGTMTERLRYIFADSTLVQEKHLLAGPDPNLEAFGEIVRARRWRFDTHRWRAWRDRVGPDGLVVAGELFSPLKMLHLAAGASDSVFLLEDHPERCAEWMAEHEAAQLDLLRQILDAGAEAVMSMDNLDAAFHPPAYVERYSASFYEKASRMCHGQGAVFLIHACGRQRALLPLIASLGVDGLEGVAYPPLGDVSLDEAMRLSGDRLIITGGISAAETESFRSFDQVRAYLSRLLESLRPYRHRFMLSASCNTSTRTPWDVIRWFRDAWTELNQSSHE